MPGPWAGAIPSGLKLDIERWNTQNRTMTTEQERIDRNARYEAGYHYVALKKPELTVAEHKAFGDQYADKYSAEGSTLAEAWEAHAANR
jgi:hypothetical protein